MRLEEKEVLLNFINTREPKIFVHEIPEFISLHTYIAGFVSRCLKGIAISDFKNIIDNEWIAKIEEQIDKASTTEKKKLSDYFELIKKVMFILEKNK